jgi:type II secretory pathway predicted ATPase ExeA
VADDPFATTADPARYVPRAACERALTELVGALGESRGPVALTGPPGLGKSLLLRLLGERLCGRAFPVHLPYPALPAADLCAWALGELGVAGDGDPEAAVLAAARRARRAIVLLVDEASLLPLAAARRLAELCAASRGALRVVTAASDAVGTGAVVAALGPELREVRFRTPMSPGETAVYVRERLERARADPATRARFDTAAVARLHRVSGGVPRLLHQAAARLERAAHAPRVAQNA